MQVNGGGNTGLMGAASEGGHAFGGTIDSVILDRFLPNSHAFSRNQLVCATMAERKAGLFERCDAIVALAGGLGTLEELAEVMCSRQLSFHAKPVVVINTLGIFDGIRDYLRTAIEHKFVAPGALDVIKFVRTPEEAVRYIRENQPVKVDKSAVGSGEM